jgi:hypothetical protein
VQLAEADKVVVSVQCLIESTRRPTAV